MALPRLLPIACLITLLLIPQPLPAKELPLIFRRQHTSVWCWAASIAMVVGHLQKFKVADCQVLSEYDVRRGGKGFCCIDPGSCTRAGGDDEMSDIMRTIFGIRADVVERPLPYEDIVREIDGGRPLIGAIDREDDKGHVIVISGYAGKRALIISDPEEGRYCIAYDDMRRDNGIGTWTKTFVFATSPASRPRCHVIQEEIPGAVVGVAPTRDRIVCEGGLGADATREGRH